MTWKEWKQNCIKGQIQIGCGAIKIKILVQWPISSVLKHRKYILYTYSHVCVCLESARLAALISLVGWLEKRGIKRWKERGIGRTNEAKTERVGGREGSGRKPWRVTVARERKGERRSSPIPLAAVDLPSHTDTHPPNSHTRTPAHTLTHLFGNLFFLLSTLKCLFFSYLCLHSLVSRWWWWWCVCVGVMLLCASHKGSLD